MCFMGLALALLMACSFISALCLSSCLAASLSTAPRSGMAPTVELRGRPPSLGESGGLGKVKLGSLFELAGDGAGDSSGVE